MKIFYLFLLFFVTISVNGQRRATAKTDTVDVEQHQSTRVRGRSRFTATSNLPENNDPAKPADPPSRRIPSRKRVADTTERRASLRATDRPPISAYEVEEVVNESPIDSFRRQSKPRVLTETHYEAASAPKRKLFDPVQTISETPEDLFKTIDNAAGDTLLETSSAQAETTHDADILGESSDTTFKTNALDISSDIPRSNEITRDFTRSQAITTPKPVDSRRSQIGARRSNGRTRSNSVELSEDSATQASRSRTRTRPTRKPDEVSTQAASRTAHRGSRKRPESSTPLAAEASRKGPSVFVAEPVEDISRLRTGRRIGGSAPEKITIDLPNSRSRDRKITATPATTTTTHRTDEETTKRSTSRFQSRNVEASHSSSLRGRSRSKEVPTVNEFPVPTASTKGRFRSRDFPPFIDEQKLEVLPLFADEPKTVRPVLKSRSRSRARSVNSADETIQMSATENDLKFVEPSEIPSRVSVTRSQSINVETRTQISVKRKPVSRVKESVIAEVTEVTSKRTVSRRKNTEGVKETVGSTRIKTDKPKVSVSQVLTSSRGKKKADVNLNEVKRKTKSGDSTEEIDETDNYPEPFKALIQAKKDKKESRPSSRSHFGVPTITTIVTSSTAPSTVASSEANKEDDELENELEPKPSSTQKSPIRPTRKRLSLTTKSPEKSTISTTSTKRQTLPSRKSNKVVRSTASPPTATTPSKENRFHAKFSSTSSTRSESASSKSGRNSAYPRGLYSSRKYKEDKSSNKERLNKGGAEPSIISTQVPKSSSPLKKSTRYSSKYRSDISSRGSASRSTTSAPAYIPTIPTAAYIPTIPTITPPRTTVYSGAGTKDVDLGLEVISFDDPVNTVPSANLVNGEFISSTENALNLPTTLVKDGTTEKPVSIIERIINSITAISTTPPPDSLKQTSTASTTESSSAILKLATKKSTKLDKTKTKQDETSQTYPIGTVTFTTEKPTTIIERILSSLSAIQATDDTNSNQVGKDFNTISSPQTTPVSRVIKSSASSITLPAQISTSVNPLSVLDEISPEQVLQKRTIGKLLNLLNGLVSSTEVPQKLVVVTPKAANFGNNVNSVESRPVGIISESTPSSGATVTPVSTLPTTISSSASIALTTSTAPAITTTTASPTISAAMSSTESLSTMVPDTATPELFTSSADNTSSTEEGVTMLNSSLMVESRIADVPGVQTTTIPSTPPATQLADTATTSTSTLPTITQTPVDMIASTVTTQTEPTIQTTVSSATTQTSSESPASSTQMNDVATPLTDNSETGALPLSLNVSADSTTITNTFPTSTEAGLTGTTDIDTLFSYLSTIPTLQNFEVSPGSVSIFSANDLSNSITPDDNFFSTITIASRNNFDATATTESTTTESGTTENSSTTSSDGTLPTSNSVEGSATTQDSTLGTTIQDTTTQASVTESSAPESGNTSDSTTSEGDKTQPIMTPESTVSNTSSDLSGAVQNSTEGSSSTSSPNSTVSDINPSNTTTMTDTSNQTNTNSSSNDLSLSNRSGRLLNIVDEPVQNSLDVSTPSTTTSTTPDYFIFAVLNNNTVLRKRPPTIPNKDTPFVIVGLYPNNTVVRKFPNGTLVPMEQIIRVRGFDIRPNPPLLPEITSNQVTNDPGSSADNKNVQTVDQNTISSLEANPLSVDTASSTSNAPEASSSTIPSTVAITTTPQSTSIGTTQNSITYPATISNTDSNIAPGTESSASSVSSTVDSTTAPSTITGGTLNQFTTAATTTQLSTLPPSTSATTLALSTTTGSATTQAPIPTLPTLSELLNGKTLEAFNSIINNTNTNTNANYQTLQVNKSTSTEVPISTIQTSPVVETTTPTVMLTTATAASVETTTMVATVTPAESTSQVPTTTQAPSPIPLSGRILETTTPQTSTNPPTTAPTTTQTTTTKVVSLTTPRLTTTPIETTLSLNPTTTPFPTRFAADSFFTGFPSFVTTLFPTLLRVTPEPPTTRPPFTTTQRELFTASASTTQPTTVIPPRRGRITFSETTTTATTSRRRTTRAPTTTTTVTTTTPAPTTTTTTPVPTTITTTPVPTIRTRPPRTTTVVPQTTPTTIAPSTRSAPITASSTVVPVTSAAPVRSTTKKLKQLTEEQKKNLETLAQLEKEQAAILEQLSFLTSLNFGGNRNRGNGKSSDLANRVISLAVERDKAKSTTAKPVTSIQDQLSALDGDQSAKKSTPSIEEVLKQYNLNGLDIATPSSASTSGNSNDALLAALLKEQGIAAPKPVSTLPHQLPALDEDRQAKKSTPSIEDILKQYNLNGLDKATPSSDSTYGKSNDALLAALLKEQGIAPSTPKSLADQIRHAGIFSETTTTKRPKPRKPTTRPPGRLMQGLNWLLNTLAPPPQAPTRRPPKPVKPKKPPVDQELLANSPTHLTPVVTAAPKPSSPNALTQDDIQKLIKQLEAVQKDPKNSEALDLTQIKSLQNLINTDEGVEVLTNSQNGATSRLTTTAPATTKRKPVKSQRGFRSTTVSTTVSNDLDDIEEDEELISTTLKPRPSLPPLRLRPVPGVDDNSDPLIRGNLISAAVNVTRAISGFLGSALQGAAHSFQSLIGSGSRLVGDYAQGSSARPG